MLRKYLLKNEKISISILSLYFTILTIFYLLSITFTLMFFALEEIRIISEPILYILHAVEVTFVKRLDLFFVYIWLSWSLITIINYVLVMRLVYFEKKRKSPVLQQFIFFAIVGITANYLGRFSVLDFIKDNIVYVNIIFTFLFPIVIIIINKIRGRTVSESHSSS